MSERTELLAALERIEENQRRSLQLQSDHLALVRAHMEETDARIKASVGLQETAVRRQARAFAILLPSIAILGALALYLTWR